MNRRKRKIEGSHDLDLDKTNKIGPYPREIIQRKKISKRKN